MNAWIVMSGMNQTPRWMIENDPLWEKLYDSAPGMLKWKKKGTSLIAICPQTSILCDIVDSVTDNGPMFNLEADMARYNNKVRAIPPLANDIRKYLSSRYLNSQYGIENHNNNNNVTQMRKRIWLDDQSR